MRYKIQNKKTDTDTDTILRSESGMVLVVTLLLMLVAVVAGITAISTSTTNVMISGNQRLSEICFSAADSGVSMTMPIVEAAAVTGEATDYDSFIKDSFFVDVDEPDDSVPGSPDLTFPVGNAAVDVDVDFIYAAVPLGCSIESLSGGDLAASGVRCMNEYYSINSLASCDAGSQGEVCGVYKAYKSKL